MLRAVGQAHSDSRTLSEQFLGVQKNNAPVTKQIDTALRAREMKNATILESITKTVLLCARQNLALRGDNDSAKYHEDKRVNCGNFQALLEFRVESGDTVLKEHFETCGKNATYRSPMIQNELIGIMGETVEKKVVSDINSGSKFFCVSADEVRDISNKEQLAICVRFTDTNATIREEFLRFVDVSPDTSGEALSNGILEVLIDVGLDPSLMRSQCYDGAGNMTGKTKGVGPRIQAQYPRALPFWCTAHQLNRCVVHASDSTLVRNMMGTVNRIAAFFNFSPKRPASLEECRSALENSEVKRQKVKALFRTRWVERHDALEIFIDFLPAMVDTMSQLMESETRSTTTAEISGFLVAITGFQFIVVLVIVTRCLSYTKALTTQLQGRSVDVVKAMSEVSVVQDALKDVRSEVEIYHQRWFEEATAIAASLDVEPSKPRTCGRQTKRDNIDAATPEEYYKRNLTIPFVDTFVNEMKTRFSALQSKAAMGLKVIPDNLCSSEIQITAADLEWFEDDLPSSQSLPAELHMWQAKWRGVEDRPTTLQDSLKQCNQNLYPNIYTVLSISRVFPVTSCECKRSISALGLVKTSMGQDGLSSLCLLSIHRDINIDIKQVVRDFAKRHPRKMVLPLS